MNMEIPSKETHEESPAAVGVSAEKTPPFENLEAAMVEEYFALQLELMALNKDLSTAVENAIDPKNENMKAVYTSVGKKFHTMIESLEGKKAELEAALKEKGLEPRDYTLQ